MNKPGDLEPSSVVAAFDFDGTLTYRDSLFPFLKMTAGSLGFYWGLLVVSPVLIAYALNLISNWRAKEMVLTHFLGGLTEEKVQQIGQRFAVQKIPKLLRKQAVECLSWHQSQGHRTILVSASPEIYLLPWAKTIGFEKILSTRLEVHNGRITGRILGKNCYGLEKVERLKAFLGDFSHYCIYAYGDSGGDREMLDLADYPYYRKFL